MNNAVFGKSMENVRKRLKVKLLTDGDKAVKLMSKSNFLDRKIFGENLISVHMQKTKLMFDKAIYVGM